jgi:hypothetical protein
MRVSNGLIIIVNEDLRRCAVCVRAKRSESMFVLEVLIL